MVEPDRPQMTIWRMRSACLVTKASDMLEKVMEEWRNVSNDGRLIFHKRYVIKSFCKCCCRTFRSQLLRSAM